MAAAVTGSHRVALNAEAAWVIGSSARSDLPVSAITRRRRSQVRRGWSARRGHVPQPGPIAGFRRTSVIPLPPAAPLAPAPGAGRRPTIPMIRRPATVAEFAPGGARGRPVGASGRPRAHPAALGRPPAAGGLAQAGVGHRRLAPRQAAGLPLPEPAGARPAGARSASEEHPPGALPGQPGLPRQIGAQLNKGEALHDLRRFLFFANEGEIRRAQHADQTAQALCLTLVTDAVIA